MAKTILIVDDDDDIRELLAARLAREGFPVVHAADGRQAIEQIGRERPGLVILDRMMPGITGDEVLQFLRSSSALRNVPVIILSAMDEGMAIEQTWGMGIADYLPKPIHLDTLSDRVHGLLDGSVIEAKIG